MSAAQNAKTFGDIPDVPVGMHFRNRRELAAAGVHGRTTWGIHGSEDGAYAIVLNGGYEDKDKGNHIIYTGHGKGRDKSGNWNSDGPQVGDQEWIAGNYALKRSHETGYPVRVIRGPNGSEKYSPTEGYRYDGLYYVTNAWEEKGDAGYNMCKFELVRAEDLNQPRLPHPAEARIWWNWTPQTNMDVVDDQTPAQRPRPGKVRRKGIKETSTLAGLQRRFYQRVLSTGNPAITNSRRLSGSSTCESRAKSSSPIRHTSHSPVLDADPKGRPWPSGL